MIHNLLQRSCGSYLIFKFGFLKVIEPLKIRKLLWSYSDLLDEDTESFKAARFKGSYGLWNVCENLWKMDSVFKGLVGKVCEFRGKQLRFVKNLVNVLQAALKLLILNHEWFLHISTTIVPFSGCAVFTVFIRVQYHIIAGWTFFWVKLLTGMIVMPR